MPFSVQSIADLGPRIVILGPSNSGKSTLANAISRSQGIKAVHIDQLAFLPNTEWKSRPDEEFIKLHDTAIAEESWITDGNYKKTLPQRMERATGVIMMDISTVSALWRYFNRCWFEKGRRMGALDGSKDGVAWEMIRFIVWDTPAIQKQLKEKYEAYTIPKVLLSTQAEIDEFYGAMGLTR